MLSSCQLSTTLKSRIYKSVILPNVLYGYELWSLPLREEHKLQIFATTCSEKVFGPKWGEVSGELRMLHNEELCGLYE
jgi:hypothetical protein